MDFEKIECLVVQAKLGNSKAKEELATEFTPLILNLSKKSFINSYENSDIKNECYHTLFKCVNYYNPDKHRFVAYATNAIKNTINNLIRASKRRNSAEGSEAYILDGNLEHTLFSDEVVLEDVYNDSYEIWLKAAIKNLNDNDRELIDFVYYKNATLKRYAEMKGIPYSTAVVKRNRILKELRKSIGADENNSFLN